MGVWLRALRYRGFAVCTALACLVVLYQLAGNLLMSFGWSASGSQLLGFDLPPLVVAEQTVCASETFAVLLPVGTALALSAPIRTGYAQLLACRSSVRGVVLQVLAAGMVMGAVFWACVTVAALVPCALLCRGGMDYASAVALMRQGAFLPDGGSSLCLIVSLAARLLASMTIGCVTAALVCVSRHAAVGLLGIPLVWAAYCYVGLVGELLDLLTLPPGMPVMQLLSWRADLLELMFGEVWTPLVELGALSVAISLAWATTALWRPRALVVRGGRS